MRRRHRWAHAPVIHSASPFYHEKRVSWVSISMHACDPVAMVMGLRLAALGAAGAPLQRIHVVIERGTNGKLSWKSIPFSFPQFPFPFPFISPFYQ